MDVFMTLVDALEWIKGHQVSPETFSEDGVKLRWRYSNFGATVPVTRCRSVVTAPQNKCVATTTLVFDRDNSRISSGRKTLREQERSVRETWRSIPWIVRLLR